MQQQAIEATILPSFDVDPVTVGESPLESLTAEVVQERFKARDTRRGLETIVEDKGRESVIEAIETVIENFTIDILNRKAPYLEYDTRGSWNNVEFDSKAKYYRMMLDRQVTRISFRNTGSMMHATCMLKVLKLIHELLLVNRYATKRDLYYLDAGLFREQRVVDEIVTEISVMLRVPRIALHIIAMSKGEVVGPIQWKELPSKANEHHSVSIPPCPRLLIDVQSIRVGDEAKFILLIEKDATFYRLVESGVDQKLHCILITGKGYADVATREFIHLLAHHLTLPILGLVDGDPHGVHILLTYAYGSRGMSHESDHLTAPCIRWLGILPHDLTSGRYNVSPSALLPMTDRDKALANELALLPCLDERPAWKKVVDVMRTQAAMCSSGVHYLADVYLVDKIARGDWI